MLKADALKFFNDNHTKLAHAIGVTRSAVSQWGPVVPWFAATDLQRVTGGKLKVDKSLYRRGRPMPLGEEAA